MIGGGGLAVPAAPGKRGTDEIVFLFKDKDKDSGVRTTFVYSKGADHMELAQITKTAGS